MMVITFNEDRTDLADLDIGIRMLESRFPEETIIALPDTLTLAEWDKVDLIKYRDFLDRLIDGWEDEVL